MWPTSAQAQVSEGGRPLSYSLEAGFSSIEANLLPTVNVDSLLIVDEEQIQEGWPYRFGHAVGVSYSLANSGT
ncbi:MAG: hypothetical protein P1R58_11070 [bacterium]|nr:hypothetical protein [bacterium]